MKRLNGPLRLGAVVILAAGLQSGCAAFGWLPWVDRTPAEDQPARLEPIDAEITFQRQWRGRVGKGLGVKYLQLAPLVRGDRIFAADAYGQVEARDRFSGALVWRTTIGRPDRRGFMSRLGRLSRRDPSFVGGLGAGDGLVLIGTMNAELIALAAGDGEELWRRRVSSEVLSAPAANDGLVFVQTQDGRLAAYDARDGRERWTYDTQVPVLTLRGTSSPVVAGGGVFAGFASGRVGVYRERTGEPIWEHRVMLPQGRSELDRIVDVDASVLPAASMVFAASYQGRVAALRPQDGSVIWEREASTFRDLAESRGTLFIVDQNDVVRAIDQQTGELRWEQRGLFRRELSSPVAAGNRLFVTDDLGYLHVMAQSDGRFVGRTRLGRSGVRSRVTVADGVVYAMGNGGRLHAVAFEPM